MPTLRRPGAWPYRAVSQGAYRALGRNRPRPEPGGGAGLDRDCGGTIRAVSGGRAPHSVLGSVMAERKAPRPAPVGTVRPAPPPLPPPYKARVARPSIERAARAFGLSAAAIARVKKIIDSLFAPRDALAGRE